MRIFNRFKTRTNLYDEFFGHLQPVKSGKNAVTILKGKTYFHPTNSVTEFFIHTDSEGPSEGQRQFYSDLQTRFNEYAEKMTTVILSEYRQATPQFTIEELKKEFQVVSIVIPVVPGESSAWSLLLMSRSARDLTIKIEFTGQQPSGISRGNSLVPVL
ncbi:MAG: hypothetical protein QM764_21320 [Chitinophagaceae bacterium]